MSGPVQVLLDLLFPPKCVFCAKPLRPGEREVCAACAAGLPFLEGEAARRTAGNCSLVVSPLRYDGVVRDSIRRYKFGGRRGYASAYGKLVAGAVRTHLAGKYDVISWVPLSDKRRRERGYDQAFLLATAAALELGDVAVETLRKVRHVDAQSGLVEDSARQANVKGAYAAVDPELVEGRRVLLIDDVVTTGSTLSECAGTLLKAGALDVVGATLARAR